jgi:hypothetical protein
MWIIVDLRIPQSAKQSLIDFGNLLEFESHNLVYDSISGHPDIFLFQSDNQLIIARNTPDEFVEKLKVNKIEYTFGNKLLGMKYPKTARFNAVCTDKLLIHNLKVTDPFVIKNCNNKKLLHCAQAYTRCNLIALDESCFITSDKGIEKVLMANLLNVLYVDPEGIKLKGFTNGFFGGCCGVYDKKLFINGSLDFYHAKEEIKSFVSKAGLTIIELYNGPLHDGGGIFFVNP